MVLLSQLKHFEFITKLENTLYNFSSWTTSLQCEIAELCLVHPTHCTVSKTADALKYSLWQNWQNLWCLSLFLVTCGNVFIGNICQWINSEFQWLLVNSFSNKHWNSDHHPSIAREETFSQEILCFFKNEPIVSNTLHEEMLFHVCEREIHL